MTQSLERSTHMLVLASAVVLAPLILKSSFAAETDRDAVAEPAELAEAPLVSPVPASDVAAPLIRAGLGADALAAVGVSANQIPTVLSAAVGEWQADPDRLPDADADYATYRQQTDALRRKIRAGKASQQEIADYPTGMTNLAQAEADREAALEALRDAAAAELSASEAQLLERIHANEMWDELPMQYRTISMSEADWVKLRKALLNAKTCAKYDEDPDPELASHLVACNADPTVATAKASCDATFGACQAAWDSYLED